MDVPPNPADCFLLSTVASRPIRSARHVVLIILSALAVACGGGGGGGSDGDSNDPNPTPALSNNANLSNIELSAVALDQMFQASQLEYTASVGYLVASITIQVSAADSDASLTVNGSPVASGSMSDPIDLAEGLNTVTLVVAAEDGTTTKTYTIEVTRLSAGSFAQQAYLKASNPDPDDVFGWSVALSGDTLAVGAYGEASGGPTNQSDNSADGAGAVYIFTRSAGEWSQQAYLKASNAEFEDVFGHSVSLSGDTLAVGAPGEASNSSGEQSDNSASGAGAVYVFVRSGESWSQQAYLKASNADAEDYFGDSIALNGDTLVVGAYNEDSSIAGGQNDNSFASAGAAYVFTRSGSTWIQQAFLKADNAGSGDGFGTSVSVWQDTLAIGANQEDTSGVDSGAVYIFSRENTNWTQQAFLKASNLEDNDYFGSSVSLYQDTLAVGADGEDSNSTGDENDNSALESGAAYVFTRTGVVWTQQAVLKASNAEDDDILGRSIAVWGDTLAVGAVGEDSSAAGGESNNSATESGAVYVFTRSGSDWSQQGYLKASNADADDTFGHSIAVGEAGLAVGGPGESSGSTSNEADNSASGAGAVYIIQ